MDIPGQKLVSLFLWLFDILEFFADIDECVQDPSPCGPNSVCTNALGSYSCGCIVGFRPNPEGSWEYGNFSCKRNHLLVCLGNGICVLLTLPNLWILFLLSPYPHVLSLFIHSFTTHSLIPSFNTLFLERLLIS